MVVGPNTIRRDWRLRPACYDFWHVMIAWRRLMLAVLLALCVGVQLLEASGRWDLTLRDANDEASIVVVVLCVGVAVAVVARFVANVRPSGSAARVLIPCLTCATCSQTPLGFVCWNSPPLSLRI
jgi:uncharacterized membrane protein